MEPRLALARLAARQEQWGPALAVLDDARRQLGDRAALRLERARIEAARGGPEAAKVVEEQARDLDRFSPDERRMLLGGLAAESLQVGATEAARRLWLALAEQEPSDLSVRLVLFDLALQADDEAAMQRLLGDFRRIEGADGSFRRYAEARHLIWRAGRGDKAAPAAARAILTALANRAPTGRSSRWPWPSSTRSATTVRGPSRPTSAPSTWASATRRSSAARRGSCSPAAAMPKPIGSSGCSPSRNCSPTTCCRWPPTSPSQAADYPRALDLSRKGVAAHPDDFREHLGFGQALWAAGRTAEAEAELRRAVALAGAVPDAWVALVGLLARTGQSAKAEAVIREAERAVPARTEGLDPGPVLRRVGRLDRAQALYQEVLVSHPDDIAAQRSLAALLLRRGAFREAEARLRELNRPQGPEPGGRRLGPPDPGDGPDPRRRLSTRPRGPGPRGPPRRSRRSPCPGACPRRLKSPARAKEAIRILEQLARRDP